MNDLVAVSHRCSVSRDEGMIDWIGEIRNWIEVTDENEHIVSGELFW